ncbi:LLM class flavin-dependent oxidoreductase [Streptomyces mirabilis]|uniref:LLM class flavin-dependent oxidoreductase n=1 Tax=Streptomyces mirabilis TaxID=68239 RepID=UPI0036D7E40D
MSGYAINVPNFGDFADPMVFATVASRAEEAGWDGLFVWDHVVYGRRSGRPIADPWILLTAAALATQRIRLGTMVTPVARRHPSKLAREVATLDRLSNGRIVLGVGLGGPIEDEYDTFGGPTDPKELAARLDEGLAALDLLWSGEPATYLGSHVTLKDVIFQPTPVQRPRVPIWVGGQWPHKAPMRRAARWDGAVPLLPSAAQGSPDPAEVRELRAFLDASRRDPLPRKPFDLLLGGTTEPHTAADIIGPLVEAGMTWWQERLLPTDPQLECSTPILRRIEQGPLAFGGQSRHPKAAPRPHHAGPVLKDAHTEPYDGPEVDWPSW